MFFGAGRENCAESHAGAGTRIEGLANQRQHRIAFFQRPSSGCIWPPTQFVPEIQETASWFDTGGRLSKDSLLRPTQWSPKRS